MKVGTAAFLWNVLWILSSFQPLTSGNWSGKERERKGTDQPHANRKFSYSQSMWANGKSSLFSNLNATCEGHT